MLSKKVIDHIIYFKFNAMKEVVKQKNKEIVYYACAGLCGCGCACVCVRVCLCMHAQGHDGTNS